MKRVLSLLSILALSAAACGGGGSEESAETDRLAATADGSALAPEESAELTEVNVAYFYEWPTPNLVARTNETYNDEVGVPVNWKPFFDANTMAAALETGEVDIAYSQGLTPFAKSVTGGADLQAVGIAVSYAEADNCAAPGWAGINAANAKDKLAGQKIYTPIGTVTHFKLLKMLEHLDVDTTDITLVESESGAAAVDALASNDFSLVCASGGAVNEMTSRGGNLLMTGAEQENIGIQVFDVISTRRGFGDAHPDAVTAFLQVTEDANEAYFLTPDQYEQTMATAAEMPLEAAQTLLNSFDFPERNVQLSSTWLGDSVAESMKAQMDFFAEQGQLDAALDDYTPFIETRYLEAVQ